MILDASNRREDELPTLPLVMVTRSMGREHHLGVRQLLKTNCHVEITTYVRMYHVLGIVDET